MHAVQAVAEVQLLQFVGQALQPPAVLLNVALGQEATGWIGGKESTLGREI